jgi:DNA repair exonuclease SbcCD ATPase subunit
MELNSIRLKDIGPFRGEVFVDLDPLGRIVAVTGENGVGKSTFLEAGYAGPIFRKTPTRDTLIKLATSRNSYAEAVITNGERRLIRQMLDMGSKKGEVLVTGADGQPILPSGKLPEFDRWVDATFPSEEVFFSSIFTAQAFAGFLGLSKSDRKAVLNRVLGIEGYEVLAQRARDRAAAAREKLQKAEARIAELTTDDRASVAEAESDLKLKREAAAQADKVLQVAKEALESARAEASQREADRRRIEEQDRNRQDLQTRLDAESKSLADVVERITNNFNLLDDAENIRAAVKRVAELVNLETQISQWDSLSDKLSAENKALSTLKERITATNQTLADAETIKAAQKRARQLVKEIEKARAKVDQLRTEHQKRITTELQHVNARSSAESLRADLTQQLARVEERLKKKDDVTKAESQLPAAKEGLAAAQKRYDDADAEEKRLNTLALSTSEDRNKNLRGGYEEIKTLEPSFSATAHRAIDIANEQLAADDAANALAKELPGQRATAGGLRAEADAQVALRKSIVQGLETTLALKPGIEAAEKEKNEITVRLAELETQIAEETELVQAESKLKELASTNLEVARTQLEKLESEKTTVDETASQSEALAQAETLLTELTAQQSRHESAITGLESEMKSIEQALKLDESVTFASLLEEKTRVNEKAKYADNLAGATARIEELEKQKAKHEAEVLNLTNQVAAIPVETFSGSRIIDPEIQAVGIAEDASRNAHAAVVLAESILKTATETAARVLELEKERDSLADDLADENLLAQSFGRDGLQALEIDAAGPELTATINDLLRSCIGSRWTVSIETTRMSADAKRTLEGCEVSVVDNEKGRITTGETLSGGQKVIISEAISLALTKLACQRSGISRPTLVRDESGAALSPVYAPKYMAMLRRAADLIDVSRIIFVSHDKEVQALADSEIHINTDGTITVS